MSSICHALPQLSHTLSSLSETLQSHLFAWLTATQSSDVIWNVTSPWKLSWSPQCWIRYPLGTPLCLQHLDLLMFISFLWCHWYLIKDKKVIIMVFKKRLLEPRGWLQRQARKRLIRKAFRMTFLFPAGVIEGYQVSHEEFRLNNAGDRGCSRLSPTH